MTNWERIAELLTSKWYAEGKLPITVVGTEYNYIYSTNFIGYPNKLTYARSELMSSFPDTGMFHPHIIIHGEVSKSLAISETWHLLTDTEKTAIMADTLGAHVFDK